MVLAVTDQGSIAHGSKLVCNYAGYEAKKCRKNDKSSQMYETSTVLTSSLIASLIMMSFDDYLSKKRVYSLFKTDGRTDGRTNHILVRYRDAKCV